MSGIAGFLAFRAGDPTLRLRLEQVMTAIAHRGPDGIGTLVVGNAALGHGWLACDGAASAGPYRLRPDGPVLTCDLLIDLREDLAQSLGLPADTPDPQLVLAAYDRWGTDCLQHLQGEFAFAIWDPAQSRLFCARDRFGVKPFALRQTPEGLAFASDPGALAGDDGIAVNENWIADYLSAQINDATATAWRGITRLEPGHLLICGPDHLPRISRYWTLEPSHERPENVPEALREALYRATRVRMRGGKVGSMLSGGMDSSTISILARDIQAPQPVPTFLLVFPGNAEMDERAYMEAVLATGGFAPHWLEARSGGTFDMADLLLAEQGQPFMAPSLPVSHAIYPAAAAAGVKVLLDGHGGDEIISYGASRVAELMAQGDWRQVWRESVGLAALQQRPRRDVFLELVSRGAGSRLVRGLARRLGPAAPTADTTFWRRLVRADLTERSDLIARTRAANSNGRPIPEVEAHAHGIVSPRSALGFEVLSRMAARNRLEARYPFFDRRVIELCIAQPAAAKMRDGWTRVLLRDAMRDVLPEAILRRRDKVFFNSELVRAMLADGTGRLAALERGGRGGLEEFVDMDALRGHIAALKQDGLKVDRDIFLQLWRAAWLDLWLEGQAGHRALSERRQA